MKIDPHAPLVAEDGLEYDDLADKILGRPSVCERNGQINRFKIWWSKATQEQRAEKSFAQWIWGFYTNFDRNSRHRVASNGYCPLFPQGLESFRPPVVSEEGDGGADSGQPGADPVHPAD